MITADKSPLSVHPRVCGERQSLFVENYRSRGSSPRVRGTQHVVDTPRRALRFIPACAGNACSTTRMISRVAVHPRVCGERSAGAVPAAPLPGSSPRVRGTLGACKHSPEKRRFIPACAGNATIIPMLTILFTVHPRVCGERRRLRRVRRRRNGSSPRVRGTLPWERKSQDCRRFIPACAGNAESRPAPRAWPPVHPRVCGERIRRSSRFSHMVGSSPRVRGTLVVLSVGVPGERFIPACAGNAPRPPCRATCPSVHPRVCGERSPWTCETSRKSGSSPRVRGTLCHRSCGQRGIRFIPACAGNASSGRFCPWRPSVHPRVCGERPCLKMFRDKHDGSSPRVRGTLSMGFGIPYPVRFIPACAGNANMPPILITIKSVHPRVCGERLLHLAVALLTAGSSPRVRGTQWILAHLAALGRFIPACAGNACGPGQPHRDPPVHPRVCGERLLADEIIDEVGGSSPRVRGTHAPHGVWHQRARFIPACAGNAGGA